ncbi:Chaperone SurA precursor [Sulfitobacter sp. THAF37]|uniref:peptidylprolyl isomerase n=1 Tax=Sulfitobacter sp. THAF37 TaxID=2587855 RepID=UPI001267D846|nr:peptidylprolyl isomerase [Sulfitobacter sp. THAF37]QFT59778.1 Chaperone SurA precursor [Sulfitobacter sp. THAF37]
MPELTRSTPSFILRWAAALGLALCLLVPPVTAQNLYAPVARVNDKVITEFEVQQRQRFLQVLNAPGTDRESVIDALIDDRLRMELAESFDLEMTPEGVRDGLTEFAGRANLTLDEFTAALGQAGVSQETFRDFVVTQLVWRELIRARYGSRVNISDAEIDRELGRSGSGGGIRVLLSEIIIPAPPQNAARVNALADRIAQSQSEAEFSRYAQQYSATASRGRGGRMPWTPLENLPPSLHPILLALAPGEVTAPLPIPNAVALFQLRGIEETGAPSKSYSEIEYAAYYIPGGRSEPALAQAARVRAEVDTCNDLYGVAQGQPESVLDRGSKAPGEIPQDIAIELAKLDPGESSTALTRSNGQTLVFLMLCSRTAEANAEVSRETVVSNLRQRKLSGYAEQLTQQLRADARIIRQ